MHPEAITLGIITVNAIVSYIGFSNPAFFSRFAFRTGPILRNNQWDRMLTSGFLHVNWIHLIFNMITLFFFGPALQAGVGITWYIAIYLASELGGNVLSLLMNRNNPFYSAVGASGAVCGVLFACIALIPGMEVNVFFAIPMPAWLFALLYTVYTLYGMRTGAGNVGHDAHLGGGLVGMGIIIGLYPDVLEYNTIALAAMAAPVFLFLIISWIKPDLMNPAYWKTRKKWQAPRKPNMTIDDAYNDIKVHRQQQIDKILDKINREGKSSLTKSELDFLKNFGSPEDNAHRG